MRKRDTASTGNSILPALASDIEKIIDASVSKAESNGTQRSAVDFAIHVRSFIDLDLNAQHVLKMTEYLFDRSPRGSKSRIISEIIQQISPRCAEILAKGSRKTEYEEKALRAAKEATRRAYAVALWSRNFLKSPLYRDNASGKFRITINGSSEILGSNEANTKAMRAFRPKKSIENPVEFEKVLSSGPSFDLTGTVALITGASSGIGRHFAATLAAAGAKIVVAARRTSRLEALAAEIETAGGTAFPVALDVADAASVTAALAAAEAALGPVDVLVNNAGIAVDKPLFDTSEADWDSVIDTNLKGSFLMAQAAARRMVATGTAGRIVNVVSILGETAAQRVHAYAASKAALIHLTRTLALELARHNIRVNAISPGYIETDFNREFLASKGERLTRRVPLRRLGRPEDLDGALLLLASAAGGYMTGAVVTVDGGMTLSAL